MKERLAGKEIDAHAGKVLPASGLNAALREKVGLHSKGRELFRGLRLFDKADNAACVVHPRDAELRHVFAAYGKDSDGRVGIRLQVRAEQMAKIHAVELVAGQYEHVL